MGSLGEFDAAVEEAESTEDPTTFTLCGEVFTLRPVSALVFMKFSRYAAEVDISDPEQMGAINLMLLHETLKDVIVPDDWERFNEVLEERRVGMATLMAISSAVMEGATGRPTESPSASRGGRSGTSRKQKRSSSGVRRAPFSAPEDHEMIEEDEGMRPVRLSDVKALTGSV